MSVNVVPLEAVFVMIVWIAFILVSYSFKPSIIGSTVNDLANFNPASTALLVMLTNAVTPATSRAENLLIRVSAPFDTGSKLTFLAAAVTFANPLTPSASCNFLLKLLNVDIVLFAADMNFEFWKSILTILLSIDVAII